MTDDLRRAAAKSAWERSAWDQGIGVTTIDGIIAVYDALRAWDVAHPPITDAEVRSTVAAEAAAHSKPIPRRVRCTCHEAGSPNSVVGMLIAISSDGSGVYVGRGGSIPAWFSADSWTDVDSDPIATAPAPIKVTDEMVDRATLSYMQDARLCAPWWAMRAALIAALSPEAT